MYQFGPFERFHRIMKVASTFTCESFWGITIPPREGAALWEQGHPRNLTASWRQLHGLNKQWKNGMVIIAAQSQKPLCTG